MPEIVEKKPKPRRDWRKGTEKTGGKQKGWRKREISNARREYWAKEQERVVGVRMQKAYKAVRALLLALPGMSPELVNQTPDELLILIPAPIEAQVAIKTLLAAAEKACDRLIATIRNIS